MMGPGPVESHPCGRVWAAVFMRARVAGPFMLRRHPPAGGPGRPPHPAPGTASRVAAVCDTCAMPELPEVETTRRGLAPHVEGPRVAAVTLRRPDLRWPIPPDIAGRLPGQRIEAVRRRAKYLLLDTAAGSALLHLGMSGSLRVLPADAPVR